MFVNFLPNKKQKDDLKHWYFYFSGELKKTVEYFYIVNNI